MVDPHVWTKTHRHTSFITDYTTGPDQLLTPTDRNEGHGYLFHVEMGNLFAKVCTKRIAGSEG